MGATITTLGNILKEFYLPPVVEQLNNDVFLLTRLNPSAEELVGLEAYLPVHTRRSNGIGQAQEGAALPAAGSQGYGKAVYDLIYLYGRVEVTGPSIAKTATAAGAFLQSVKSELDGIRNDLKKDLARQVYGSGKGNARVAQCGTTTAVRVVVLSSPEAVLKGHLYVGMLIDIVDGTYTPITDGTNRYISDVDIVNGTVTIVNSDGVTAGNPVTTSSANYIVRHGNSTTASGGSGLEITGIADIVSTTANTIGKIDSTAAGNGFWKNIASTGDPTIDKLNQAFGNVMVASGETPTLGLMSYGVQRFIANLFTANTRYVNEMELKGGYKAVEWRGLPLMGDVDHPFGRYELLVEKHLKVFSPRDWHFMDEDGLTLRQVSGYDKWEALLTRYINLGTDRRNCQLVNSGVTDATGF